MSKHTPQQEMILRYMRDFGSITPLDALREFGCMRLGARIYDLKRRGHQINSTMDSSTNRYGHRVRYARYSLRE
jgi:hypothetical protein